jgi:hypothetical protein
VILQMKVNHQVEISRWDTFVRDNGPVLHMLPRGIL